MKRKKADLLPEVEMPDTGELPEGWELTKLRDLVTLNYGKGLKEANRDGGNVQVFGSNGIVGSHNIAITKSPVIIIGRKGSIGEIHYSDNPAWPIDTTYFIDEFKDIDPTFFVFALKMLKLSDLDTSTAIPGLNRDDIYEQIIPLPPLDEQQRIVARIEALLAHVNTARERLNRVPLVMKRFRQGVLAVACSGKLTEGWRRENPTESVISSLRRISVEESHTGRQATDNIIPGVCILSVGDPETPVPVGWLRVPLTRIARLESGHTPSRQHPEFWDGDVLWIGIDDARIHHGGYIEKTLQHPTSLGLENSAARLLPPDTVCLSRTASVGYVVIMKKTMATSQDFVNWICSDALLPKFLMYAFMAEGEGIRKFGRGTTHTTIYYPEVKALHICLPPISEQQEIVHRIEKLLARVDTIEREVAAATKRAEALTQAVLARAFAGKL